MTFSLVIITFSSSYLTPDSSSEIIISSQDNLKIIVSDQQVPAIMGIIDDFLADPLGSGVDSIEVIASGTRAEDQHSYLVEQMLLKSNEFDVIGLDTIWLAQFAENGWVEALDSRLESNELSNFADGLVKSCKYNGKTYAYPYFMNLGILYYRKDLIKAYNFTENDFNTWAELNTTANHILKNENFASRNPNLVGFISQFDTYEGAVVNFFEWAASFGATGIINSNGDVNIINSGVEDAMTFLQELTSQEGVDVQLNSNIIPYECINMDESLSMEKWLAGEAIFMRQWTFAYTSSINYNISFGVLPLPTATDSPDEKSSCVGGSVLAIPAFSQNKAAAWNLIKFLGKKLAQEFELTNASNFPALKSVYDNPPSNYEWIQNWKEQLGKTITRPVHPKYSLISSVIAQNMNDLLSFRKDVNTALTDMNEEITRIIDEKENKNLTVFIILATTIATSALSLFILSYIRRSIQRKINTNKKVV